MAIKMWYDEKILYQFSEGAEKKTIPFILPIYRGLFGHVVLTRAQQSRTSSAEQKIAKLSDISAK